MENATKALMIAGAVLMAIMLISVGLLIYQSAQGTIDQAMSKMSSQEKTVFNDSFLSYEGTQTGSNVKALISSIITNNTTATENGEDHKIVSFQGQTETDKLTAERTKIVSGKKYTVTVSTDSKTGLVNAITVEVFESK